MAKNAVAKAWSPHLWGDGTWRSAAEVGGGSSASGTEQDWIDRSTSAGVTQAIRFDTSSNVTSYRHIDGQEANVVQNANGGILGDGCLRINVPTSSGSNPGAWRAPLNSSWTTDSQGFGTSDFYFQFRVKLGPNRFNDDSPAGTDNGFKICNISQYKQSSPNSSQSHLNSEVVMQFHGELSQILLAYRDAASAGGSSAELFDVDGFLSTIRHQNAVDHGAGVTDPNDRYCLYTGGGSYGGLSAGCVTFEEEVWYTIYCHMKIATPNGSTGNTFEMWYAGPTDAAYKQLYSMTNQLMGYDADAPNGNNGIWLLPYKTSRTSGVADTYHEYDQVIVSTSPIACPRPLPAWFGSTLNTWFSTTAKISDAQTYTEPSGVSHSGFCSYSGGTIIGTKVYIAGGGHLDGASNAVMVCDLDANSPAFTLLRTATASVAQNVTHYSDGRPSSRHSSWDVQGIAADNKLFFFGGWAYHGNGGFASDHVDAFDLATNDYAAANTYAQQSSLQSGNAPNGVCQDASGNVYVWACGNGNLYKWTRSTKAWSTLVTGESGIIYNSPMAYDPVNNRLIYIGSGGAAKRVNLSTNAVSSITWTGAQAGSVGNASQLIYVDVLACFLLKPFGSSTIYRIDPITFAVTTYSVSGTAPSEASDGVNNVYGRFNYCKELGIVYYLSQSNTNLSAFRVR